MKKSFQAVTIFAFLFCVVSYSKDFSVKTYTSREGLSTNNVFSGVQDKKGKLWFATADGAMSYDGYEWISYTVKNSPVQTPLSKTALDSLGQIWFAPPTLSTPILCYDQNNGWKSLPLIPFRSNTFAGIMAFTVIMAGTEPEPVVGCEDGLYIYRKNKWQFYAMKAGQAAPVQSLASQNNVLYIGTSKGLFTARIGAEDILSVSAVSQVPASSIRSICFDISGAGERLYLVTGKWLGCLQNGAFKIIHSGHIVDYIDQADYNFISSNNMGSLIIGNRYTKALFDIASKKITKLTFELGFVSDGSTFGFIDREKNIWITDMRGISKINWPLFRNFTRKDGLLEDEVSAVLEFAPGKFIFGHNNGFTIKAGERYLKFPFTDKRVLPARILDLALDRNKSIWAAASNSGLLRIMPDGTFTQVYSEKLNPVLSVCQTDKFGFLIGTRVGLFSLSNNRVVPFPHKSKHQPSIRKIFQIDGKVYCSGPHGLYLVKEQGADLVPLISTVDPKTASVFALCKQGEGLLVGAENGLFKLTNGKLTEFHPGGLTITEPVYFIVKALDNSYWIGTENGVFRWNEDGFACYYSIVDGLAGYETNRSAGYLDSGHNIWIGTSSGLSLYVGKDKERSFPPPLIDLTGFETGLQKFYPMDRPANLDYVESTLNFHFKAISFFNEKSLQYRVKLEGYDSTWKIINQDQLGVIKYSNLQPGKYRLVVSVRYHFTNWSAPVASQVISISSPFYLQFWFIAIFCFAAIGSAYLFFKFYVVRRNAKHLEQMVHRRTEALQLSESALKQTLDNLEALVQKRTIELADANAKLSKEIEERRNFEIVLSESEIRFRKLINESWDIIALTDAEGDIIFISASVKKLLGYDEREIIGQPWGKFIHPDDTKIQFDDLFRKHEGNNNVVTLVLRAFHKDGSLRYLEANMVNMIHDPSVEAVVAHCRDITEKKANEEELNKYSRQLETLNTAKDKLFSIIAHDLRSPFTAILGYASVLKADSEHMSRPEINRCATNIEIATKNTLLLIEGLLDWSRTQLGGIEFNPKETELNAIVMEIFYLLHPDSVNKKIILRSDIPVDTIVIADENLLKTIIRNLLHNAIKFTRSGGQISVTAKNLQDGMIEVSVQDSGIGIPPDAISAIFELNSQASRRGTANERGTGLGLSLCKEFIEKHGGTIHVESVVDQGTTFVFTLPSKPVSQFSFREDITDLH